MVYDKENDVFSIKSFIFLLFNHEEKCILHGKISLLLGLVLDDPIWHLFRADNNKIDLTL